METEPAESQDSAVSKADDEPAEAVAAGETTPVWAQTARSDETSAEYQPTVPDESFDTVLPEPEATSNGDGGNNKTPEWAQTVQTEPGQPIPVELKVEEQPPSVESEVPAALESAAAEPSMASITEPPKAVAADAAKDTWPPASEAPPAPPAETDIWPPEPPTEHAMPVWPPPSELEEEPETPAQAIPSWPDSFDSPAPAAASTPAAPASPTSAPTAKAPSARPEPAPEPAKPAAAAMPPTIPPPAPKPTVAPAAPQQSAPPVQPAPPTKPPAPTVPVHTEPPVAPAQPGPPLRPAWAPHAAEEPAAQQPHTTPPAQMNVPAWAPRVPLASEPGTPTWFSPKEQVRHTAAQPAAEPAKPQPPAPLPPVEGGQLPVAKVAPQPAPQPQPAQPAQPAQPQDTGKPTWQVVDQPRKSGPHAPVEAGPTAEDRSYAEWFAWAKRGGAPASACHAAAQGAFKALAAGKDVQTAVQWATAAMSRPPENVAYTRQTYCAWFSLGNIDLNLDQHRAHAFAMSAVRALDGGADASQAHAAGMQAAGIR